jgi:hypothetical protein
MEMPYVIHGGLSDDPLLSPEIELPELQGHRIEPVISTDIELPKPRAHRVKPEQFFRGTPQEHLREAKKALADGYKPNRNPMKTVWGRVADAQRHLCAINERAKEYKEAQRLMKEVHSRMEEMEKVSSTLARRLMIKQREMVADEFEFLYLAKGFDARIALSGPDKSYLKMECPPLCESFILKIVQDTDLLLYLERAGFKKVTLGDGERFSWTHNFGPG